MGYASHHDNRNGWMAIFHFLKDGHAAENRHIHFEQHACEFGDWVCLSESCEPGYAIIFPLGLESPLGQLAAHRQTDVIIMINHQDAPTDC